MSLEDEERYCREVLAQLQKEYAKAAKPYVDQLMKIHSLRPVPPMYMLLRELEQLPIPPALGQCHAPVAPTESANT